MDKNLYFFDSYAVIEILLENENYKKYANASIVLTKLNIFEIYYNIAKDKGDKIAKDVADNYYPFVVEYGKDIIEEAAKFRLKYKKNDLSMTDCIGYFIALKYKIKFLTGDKQFENFPNVEFVK